MSDIIPCPTCGGECWVTTPHVGLDDKGEPITWQEMTACQTCSGRGSVEV